MPCLDRAWQGTQTWARRSHAARSHPALRSPDADPRMHTPRGGGLPAAARARERVRESAVRAGRPGVLPEGICLGAACAPGHPGGGGAGRGAPACGSGGAPGGHPRCVAGAAPAGSHDRGRGGGRHGGCAERRLGQSWLGRGGRPVLGAVGRQPGGHGAGPLAGPAGLSAPGGAGPGPADAAREPGAALGGGHRAPGGGRGHGSAAARIAG